MQKIFNWTIGSFFRSIGRIFAYLVIGGIISYLLYTNTNFRISDLLGIQKVSASTYTGQHYTPWTNGNTDLPTLGPYGYVSLTTAQNITSDFHVSSFFLKNKLNVSNLHNGQLIIPTMISVPVVSTSTTSSITGDDYCERWTWGAIDSYNNVSRWDCARYATNSDSTITDREYLQPQVQTYAIIVYETGYYDTCTYDGNKQAFICDIANFTSFNEVQFLNVWSKVFYQNTSNSYTYYLGLGQYINMYAYDNKIEESINNQTQVIQDTNSTSESSQASDFFHDYNETAQDGIIAIVNMPLNIFNALTLGSTQDLCFNLKGKQVCLPSGDIIWGKTSRTSIRSGNATFTPHPFSAGGSLSEPLSLFKGLFNLVVGGYLCYKMLKSLMRITNDMLNPTKDKLEVLEL